jgi:hypothetical protein
MKSLHNRGPMLEDQLFAFAFMPVIKGLEEFDYRNAVTGRIQI